MQLSERVQRIKPSATLALFAKAAALKAQGKNIIALGVGEPDFDTPDYIKQAAIKAIEQGFTKYTPVEGILSLRQAVIQKFIRDNQLHYDPKQILISSGGKQSFFNLVQALVNPGDEFIVPTPYWTSYPDMILLGGGIPVFLKTDITQGFKITATQLEQAITSKTRFFVINSPSNPTGVAYTRKELEALAQVLLKHPNIIVVTDDMYEHIYWGKEPFCNIVMACPQLYDRSLVLNGVSKSYAMTGWRIGYAGGPESFIQAMNTIQGQSTSNACSISQMAAKAALEGDQRCVKDMVHAFKERHDFVIEKLNNIPGIKCLPGEGAFYAFPNVQEAIQKLQLKNSKIQSDNDLSDYLLNTAEVAVVPGAAFGAPGYLRLSFATSLENLEEGLNRIKQYL